MTQSVRDTELPKKYEPATVMAFDEVMGLTGGIDPRAANSACLPGTGFYNWTCNTGKTW